MSQRSGVIELQVEPNVPGAMRRHSRAIGDRLSSLNDWYRKLRWLLVNRRARETCPIFIVGAQRSGTGMLGTCLGKSPEFENLGESDPRAFEFYSLRDLDIVNKVIESCRFPFIVFKPLKDSYRIEQLLSLNQRGKAIWAYRNFLDRINSAVRQFGRHPLEVFESFQKGDNSRWQLRGVSDRTAQVLRNLDLDALSESDGAALMWWVRNSLFFDLSLQDNRRVRLWSYDRFVTRSESELRALLAFFGAEFHYSMLKGVHGHSVRKDPPPALDQQIHGLCQALYERLELAMREQISRN